MRAIFIILILYTFEALAKADCSEKTITITKLREIASNPRVKTINDFIDRLPSGTLQNFTLVKNSESLQKGEGDGVVSAKWPRVLRSSTDGKITISYVCNPKSSAINTVEVIYFNDERNKFETHSYTLDTNSNRVVENDSKCLKCHSENLRPNWPSYFTWSGCDPSKGTSVYGSIDDNMNEGYLRRRTAVSLKHATPNCNDQENHQKELEDFREFRNFQKNNPCYSSLPWENPSRIDKDDAGNKTTFESYPYIGEEGSSLEVRANLRFTKNYGKLQARALYQRFKGSPQFEQVKSYLAMESIPSCLTQQDKEALGNFLKIDSSTLNRNDSLHINSPGFYDPAQMNPVLYNFTKKLGFQKSDWSLEFGPTDQLYDSGMNTSMGNIISGLIASDILPQALVEEIFEPYNDADDEKSDYSCMNGAGNPLKPRLKPEKSKEVCAALRQTLPENLNQKHGVDCVNCSGAKSSLTINSVDNLALDITNVLDQASILRGKSLVNDMNKGKCIACHSPNSQGASLSEKLLFIPQQSESLENRNRAEVKLRERLSDPEFIKKVADQLEAGRMPMISPEDLNQQDKQDIVNYIRSFSVRKTN